MLIQALTDHFNSYFYRAKHHDTVLWFDPDQEYVALLDHLTDIPLWRYEDSLLQVRYRLVKRAPGERAVVYLPLSQKDAEILRPFFATSLIFRERLYRFLRRQGLDFPDDPEVAHELRALLPRLAARSVGKGRVFWEYNLANLERARETLLGNFDDALLRFLTQPQVQLTELKREKLDGLFFAQLESAYGLAADPEDDPDEVARRLAAQLILTCAYMQAEINLREHDSELEDFPYPARLAEPLHRERCWTFVTRWQNDRTYSMTYARLADELQMRYDLTRWAVGLPHDVGLTLRDTFANVQEALWTHVEKTLDSLASEDEWRNWLQAHDGSIAARADDFWAREGRDPGWRLLVLARDLLTAIHWVRQQLDRLTRPSEVLRSYAEGWYCTDQDYRRLREALDASPRSHDRLRDRCARSYRDILRRMNDRFCTLLEAEGRWPPEALPAQDAFWAQAIGEPKPVLSRSPERSEGVAEGKGRRVAIMFVDALRYELGQELREALESENAGDRRQLAARLAAIPTVTSIGMAALLPGGDRRQVAYSDDWEVTIEGSGNLKEKGARRQWLERHLKGAAFYNLEELLNTPTDRIPEVAAYIIFDTTLDAVGETASTLAWNTFSTLLQSVKKGVHKLLALGVNEVHVVADHGFLLLDEVGEHEKVSVRTVPAPAKKSRYLVGPHLGKTEQLRFPVPGSQDLVAWFPRGIGCFRTPGPYNYVHGGLSLQELVVPHLTVTQQVLGRPVGVQVKLPKVIRSAQFKVVLQPVSADIFDQPRQVALSLEKAGQAVIPPLSCIVRPSEPTTIDVFLPMGCGLEPGDQVRWLLRDAVTDEVLAEQEAVSEVDLW
ncbi:MAG: PglZ domain-containing protein [Chloroflexi bacterium]|nr:PglZ domain-containing protein [Chloroflexota bacterium]